MWCAVSRVGLSKGNVLRYGDIPVYNYVSDIRNPLKWGELKYYCELHGYSAATTYAVWHNWVIVSKSWLLFIFLDFFLHRIPAILADYLLKFMGKKPIAYKIYCKSKKIVKLALRFVTYHWDFRDDKVQDLWSQLKSADKEIFPFDIQLVNWRDQMLTALFGLRRYILKESDDTLEQGRRRRLTLHILHYVTSLLFFGLIIWTTWKLFCGRSLSIFSIPHDAI